MSKNDGGPAFPASPEIHQYPGASLRDYLATHAEGLSAESTAERAASILGWDKPTMPVDDNRAWYLWWIAADAACRYQQADAMLKAREVPQ